MYSFILLGKSYITVIMWCDLIFFKHHLLHWCYGAITKIVIIYTFKCNNKLCHELFFCCTQKFHFRRLSMKWYWAALHNFGKEVLGICLLSINTHISFFQWRSSATIIYPSLLGENKQLYPINWSWKLLP